ncbi:MAG: TetR family transcriptional regulator C-terminal domain-containing protein [Rhodobacteraceae bacterium]|nr:TetR family transcriptional regulator C-terminal domain-containing protein [Paracoccaceae bacterium]
MNDAKLKPRRIRDTTKERHRKALIEATADAILDHGLASVSISRILEIAGLSRGMVNLHFSTKNGLLIEVARYFADAYVENWQQAMEAAGPRPEDQLRALIKADFDPSVLNRRAMAVWMAFRAEAHSTPEYLPFIDSRDTRMQKTLHQICATLTREGPYPHIYPRYAAHAFIAVLEGLWTDFHLHPDRFNRDEAREVVLHMARGFFPRHFPED